MEQYCQKWLKMRLAQECADLIVNGYRIISRYGDKVFLRHPNGNRITMLVEDKHVYIMRNGQLINSIPAPFSS